ncbi:MAG TPA: LDCC motif putative metal-binding protein [Mobilitalea sp.]|nr:LDCC motif putative metal-binding protein [Mobilitalea sp.]
MSIWKKIKRAVGRYLDNLAEENKKTFGEGKLDCCNLNNKNQKK